jgi:hypothetical protein
MVDWKLAGLPHTVSDFEIMREGPNSRLGQSLRNLSWQFILATRLESRDRSNVVCDASYWERDLSRNIYVQFQREFTMLLWDQFRRPLLCC